MFSWINDALVDLLMWTDERVSTLSPLGKFMVIAVLLVLIGVVGFIMNEHGLSGPPLSMR